MSLISLGNAFHCTTHRYPETFSTQRRSFYVCRKYHRMFSLSTDTIAEGCWLKDDRTFKSGFLTSRLHHSIALAVSLPLVGAFGRTAHILPPRFHSHVQVSICVLLLPFSLHSRVFSRPIFPAHPRFRCRLLSFSPLLSLLLPSPKRFSRVPEG